MFYNTNNFTETTTQLILAGGEMETKEKIQKIYNL